MFLPDIAGTPPRQVLERQRTVHHLLRNLIIGPALENYPATVHSGVRSHVNQHIGRADDLLIVLHHDKRVADVPELAQDSDKPVRVTWMQADAWFVKNVHRADQRASQSCHQIDPLTFATGKGVACPAQGQIRQTDILYVPQTRDDLFNGLANDRVLVVCQLQVREEVKKLIHVHVKQFRDRLPSDFHVQCLRTESRAVTSMTGGPSRESAQHVLVLDLVPVGLNPLEELVDSDEGTVIPLNTVCVPDDVLDLLRQIAVRLKNRNPVTRRHLDQMIPEPAHRLAFPTGYGSIVNAFGLVRNHKVLADPDDLSEASADRARPKRAVEREEIFIRLAERHSVQFKAVGIFLRGIVLAEDESALAHPERRVNRGAKSCL